MFTDKYIKLPIKIYEKSLKELTGKEELVDSWIKINPFDISTYRPSEEGQTLIEFRNGTETLVYLSTEQFESKLNNFINQFS